MIPRRAFLPVLLAFALALSGCVAWQKTTLTYSYRRQRNLITGRADREEHGVTVTVPLFECQP